MPDDTPTFCDDCGQPAVGTFEFFYPNPASEGGPPSKHAEWCAPRTVCLLHKHVREAAGHRSRIPNPNNDTGNAPDPTAHDSVAAGAAALKSLQRPSS